MAWFAHWRCARWISDHFAGRLPSSLDEPMRKHIRQCEECRVRYDLHLAAEGTGGEGAKRRHERLARAVLGSAAASPDAEASTEQPRGPDRPTWSWSALSLERRSALLVGLAAIVLAVLFYSPDPPHEREFVSRGGASCTGQVALWSYVGPTRLAPGSSIRQGEQIRFVYRNLSGGKLNRLMIFAVDEQGEVHWFYPLYTNVSENPRAYPVDVGREIGLPYLAGGHTYGGASLKLYALFTSRQDLTVKEVEAIVAQSPRGPTRPSGLPWSHDPRLGDRYCLSHVPLSVRSP